MALRAVGFRCPCRRSVTIPRVLLPCCRGFAWSLPFVACRPWIRGRLWRKNGNLSLFLSLSLFHHISLILPSSPLSSLSSLSSFFSLYLIFSSLHTSHLFFPHYSFQELYLTYSKMALKERVSLQRYRLPCAAFPLNVQATWPDGPYCTYPLR